MSSFKRTYTDTCPIAAQASQGAIAVIRTSGQGVIELLARVFSRPQALLNAQGNTIVYGWINDSAGSPVDEVLVSVYRAPRSYTGEDAADISCHGGSAAVKAVLETLRKAGFADALPGEFTFRSFMNGKIDLTQSESVMELVSAKTKQGLDHAVKRLSGILGKEINEIRDKLLEAVSAAELFLDYPEDEIEEELEHLPHRTTILDTVKKLKALAASYRREKLYQEGALAVIVGRPNAGKSSLFNALLNEDRSIVTGTPGTTRDWIESSAIVEGIPLRLADTAGLRTPSAAAKTESSGETESSSMEDAEILGIQRSRELAEEADIVLYTIDVCEGLNKEDKIFLSEHFEHSKQPLILVLNKTDIKQAPVSAFEKPKNGGLFSAVPVSAKTGEGIADLCISIAALLTKKTVKECDMIIDEAITGLGTQRQKELTEKTALLLEEALEMADKKEPLDLIAPLLRESLNVIGEITGEVSSADILETMFSRFCLGK